MPELPDLSIVADAFHAALADRTVVSAIATAPLAVRGTPTELTALSGRRLRSVRRTGKFLVFDLEPDRLVVNPMLTGRFQLAPPKAKRPGKTAFVLAFGNREGGPPKDAAPWTRGADWVPADDAAIEVRYRDPTQMGKVYVVPADVDRWIPGFGDDERGPDADAAELTLEVWRDRIRRHPGELKNLLKNQAFVAGIGNAYSDEVLHEAALLPFRKRSTLSSDDVDRLYQAMRTTLARAIDTLRERVPPTFETQVRDFLAVHDKGGQPCPRCRTRITQVSPGGFVTSYCRGCQR